MRSSLCEQAHRPCAFALTPIGLQMFASVEEMAAIPRLRRPKAIHTFDQIVAQAARLGWTVGITAENLVGAQCAAVIGLHRRNAE